MKILKKLSDLQEEKLKIEKCQEKQIAYKDRRQLNDLKINSLSNAEYFKQIVDFVLNEDKFRCKLLKMALNRCAIDAEKAFPKESATDRFDYIGSGSYAVVYRHETFAKRNRILPGTELNEMCKALHHQPKKVNHNFCELEKSPNHRHTFTTSIIKLIDVFSESLLKNLIGLCSRSSVTTYRDAYNEFKISLTLSYLNNGISFGESKHYRCSIFPEVYACHIVKYSIPTYFKNSSEPKKLDYMKLITVDDVERNHTDNEMREGDANVDNAHSKPSLKDIHLIKPEIAALKMEDCGEPIFDMLKNFKPFEVLSLVKQVLLGFMVAEAAFEFEHRDLHLGNILVKKTCNDYINIMYIDKVITLPSYRLQVKIIDTTFSRLKLRNKVFYRDLSHLFEEKEMQKQAGENNRLSHQDETYQAMASEVKTDWAGYYPRTNIYWCIYIIKKFLRFKALRKNMARDAQQVKSMLNVYVRQLFQSKNMHCFFAQVYRKPELNKYVPITVDAFAYK